MDFRIAILNSQIVQEGYRTSNTLECPRSVGSDDYSMCNGRSVSGRNSQRDYKQDMGG